MKRAVHVLVLAGVLLALSAVPATASAEGRGKNEQSRNVSGQVLDRSDRPMSDAIVYLQNTRTMAVKTFITDASGAFRFHGLAPNTDYQVYAEHKGQKSDTKTLSAFDSRQNVTIYLRIK